MWLFSSGPLGDPPIPAADSADVAELSETVVARGHRTFAGSLVQAELGMGERLLVRLVKAPYGDFRDWSAVEAWASEIAESLAARTAAGDGAIGPAEW